MRTALSNTKLHLSLPRSLAAITVALALSAPDASAQRAGITSPGAPVIRIPGQTTRFDNDFNPAISIVTDVIVDFLAYDGPSSDGLDANLRRIDLLIADWIDPSAFTWVTLAYEDEEIVLDEGAIEYVDLPGNHTVRAGRFFVDFGKQMQAHIEELRTTERPLVLREYLGEELAGTGVQWDLWSDIDDETLIRYSIGAFGDLEGGHGHGEEEDEEGEVEVAERKGIEDFGFTGRVTALTELDDQATLQVGASVRILPHFTFANDASGIEVGSRSNFVYGLDATYGWIGDDGISNWTAGGELLVFDGDLSAAVDDNGTPADPTDDSLAVNNDTAIGSYLYFDRGWSRRDSAGIQFSIIDSPEREYDLASELDLYYTRNLSEFLRLRFGASFLNVEHGEDSARLAIQFTGFIGSHGHGLNW